MFDQVEGFIKKYDTNGILLSFYLSITMYLTLPVYSTYTQFSIGSRTYNPLPTVIIYALILLIPIFAIISKCFEVDETLRKYNIADRVQWEIGNMPPPPKYLSVMRLFPFVYIILFMGWIYFYVTSIIFPLFEGWNSIIGIISNLVFLTQLICAVILVHYKLRITKKDIVIEKIKRD